MLWPKPVLPPETAVVGRDPQQAAATAQVIALQLDHPRRKSQFWRHFLGMNAAMFIGMAAGGLQVSGILAAFGTTPNQARLHYPELAVLAGHSVPRHAGRTAAAIGPERPPLGAPP